MMDPKRADFLALVIIVAIEGGINYWADYTDYRFETDPNSHLFTDAYATILDAEGDLKEYPLDFEVVERGIALIKTGGFPVNRSIKASILVGDAENDAGEIDSEAADCIVQAGIFGKLVYG